MRNKSANGAAATGSLYKKGRKQNNSHARSLHTSSRFAASGCLDAVGLYLASQALTSLVWPGSFLDGSDRSRSEA